MTAVVAGCLLALTANAADEAKPAPKPTPEQKQAFQKQMLAKYDKNKDGKIDKEERAKMSEADQAKMKEMRGPRQSKGEKKKPAAE